MSQTIFASPPSVHIEPSFLEPADHADLLADTLANEIGYEPSQVTRYEGGEVKESRRNERTRRSRSRDLDERFVALFHRKVREIASQISKATGMPFPQEHKFETEASYYGDGAFFANHIDTITGKQDNHRVISAIYYYSRVPKAFGGGELTLYSIDKSASITVEPEDNSMVFFPSFFPHEVLPVSVSSGLFADGRFSINCWVQRID